MVKWLVRFPRRPIWWTLAAIGAPDMRRQDGSGTRVAAIADDVAKAGAGS
jgi:hypothetical protein